MLIKAIMCLVLPVINDITFLCLLNNSLETFNVDS